MKATDVNGTPTVKLSDEPGKHTGAAGKVAAYEDAFLGGPPAERRTAMSGVPSLAASEAVAAGKAAPPTGGVLFEADRLEPGRQVRVTDGRAHYEVRRIADGDDGLQFRVSGSNAGWKALTRPGAGWVIGD